MDKNVEKTYKIPNDDVLQPTSWDNRWVVKSQTPTIITQWYLSACNSFRDYGCCSCEYALRGNFCKHHITI